MLSATRTTSGHFPGISGDPLVIGSGSQAAMARFHAEGFEAAAVTAFGMAGAAMLPRPLHRIRIINLCFDRPFGFLAVQRSSRLVLAAGWVADPLAHTPEPEKSLEEKEREEAEAWEDED